MIQIPTHSPDTGRHRPDRTFAFEGDPVDRYYESLVAAILKERPDWIDRSLWSTAIKGTRGAPVYSAHGIHQFESFPEELS